MHARSRRDKVPYEEFEARGFIRATPGGVVDYNRLQADILDLASIYVVREIAFDRYMAMQLILNLGDEGLTMVPFGQGFVSMSAPTKELYSLVLKNKIIHNNNPVLRWNMDNVCVETDAAENIKVSKKASTERIDGVVATVMALDRCIRNEGQQSSIYDERDMIII